MRANYKLQRLFTDQPLGEGVSLAPDAGQTNYLLNVLRLADGAEILLFNGRDGEWRAVLERTGKKAARLACTTRERPQPPAPDLIFAFAPLKAGRLDYMIQKAVEMGAGVLQPVITAFTQNHRLSADKMHAWAIEAAEQCGVLAVPQCREPVKLDMFLDGRDRARALVFCDEAHGTDNPLSILQGLDMPVGGVLIGPEGGFSDAERAALRALPFVTAIPLGPRILRADTAAVAALTAVQMTSGDWG